MLAGRRILRLDGIFELLLASLILVPAASGAHMEAAFGLNEWLVIAIGIALVPVGVLLLIAKPERPTLLALGVANGVGALVFAVYLAVRSGEMNAFGVSVVGIAIVGLVVLALAERRLGAAGRAAEFVA